MHRASLINKLLGPGGGDEEEEVERIDIAKIKGSKKGPSVVYDAATQKALRKLNDELRIFEYRSHFDMRVALDKSNNSFREARHYLHWQERLLYDKKVRRAEAEEEQKQRSQAHKRKLALAPTLGAPTLRNPVADLIEGKPVKFSQDEVVRRYICRCLAARELKLDSRRLEKLPTILGSTLGVQLGRFKTASACLNKLTVLLSVDSPALSLRQFRHVGTLRLTSNALHQLPADLGLLQGLRSLHLDNNNIDELPVSLTQLKNLTYLNLRQNRMVNLPPYLGMLQRLQYLDVSKNLLTEVCHTFHLLTSLTYLDLSENKFQHLAVLPDPRAELWPPNTRNCPLDWTVVIGETDGKPRYFNKVTGNVSSVRPSVLKDLERIQQGTYGEEDARGQKRSLRESSEEAERKQLLLELAMSGRREWDTPVDYATGFMQFLHTPTQTSQTNMPASLDKLGWNMGQLRVLKLSQNLLRSLPDSMSGMTSLEVLEANNNYLKRLPNVLKHWTKMKSLQVASNDLVGLPDFFHCLPALTELHATSNLLQTLPDSLGTCKHLAQLRLGQNQLTKLPYTFGYLTALKELQVFGNPIVDPPMSVLSGQRDQLLWALRQKHKETTMGPPPTVTLHRSGVANERLTPLPGFHAELEKLLKDGPKGKCTAADLRLKGLERLPPPLLRKEGLETLDLSFNDLHTDALIFPPCLSSLTDLRLWRCKLTELDPSISSMQLLQKLNLEENRLRLLPDSLCKLRRLQTLRLSENLLCALPRRFGFLNALSDLHLDGNVLETLPSSFSRLVSLKSLSLARNRLVAIDESLLELRNLEHLNLESNDIAFLPDAMGMLRCKSILLAMNRLEFLDENFLQPNLCHTLTTLRLAWNNLIELPLNFFQCENLSEFTYECNPLRSPPPELLAEDLGALYKYGRLRKIRLEEVTSLLTRHSFDFDASRLCPFTQHVVTGNTGFLTPRDLKDFDEAIDAFVNGKFYACGFTAEEIVGKLARLRHERNLDFYRRILEAVLRVIELELPHDTYGMGCLVDEVSRPWGRDGEVVYCYGLALHALLEDRPPTEEGQEHRPSIYNQALAMLPPTVFHYDKHALRDAIRAFTHQYGRVAYVEQLQYPACECVDPDSGEWLNHEVCTLPSLVIVRSIYTLEEAARREAEEKEMDDALVRIGERVLEFLATKEGRDALREELLYRRDRFQGAILARESRIADLQDERQSIETNLAVLRKREAAFINGLPFEYHRIRTAGEIGELITEADQDTAHFQHQIDAIKADIRALETQKRMSDHELCARAAQDLVHKYTYFESEKMLYIRRREAFRQRWRRPWDGDDGADFMDWIEHKTHPENVKVDWERVSRIINRMEGTFAYDEEDDDSENGGEEPEEDIHFTWEGCEHMEQFDNSYVARVMARKQTKGLHEALGAAMERFGDAVTVARKVGRRVKGLWRRMWRREDEDEGEGEGVDLGPAVPDFDPEAAEGDGDRRSSAGGNGREGQG